MNLLKPQRAAPLLATALALAPLALLAQNSANKPAGRLKLGKIEGDFQFSKLTPSLWHFGGKLTVTSEMYDFAGQDLKVYFVPNAGGKRGMSTTVDHATALGDPAKSIQVLAHVHRPLEGQDYDISADRAVYTPDKTRAGFSRMDFTGRVKVVLHSGFLVGPAPLTTEQATILLGPGDDYPQLETGLTHISATPAQ